MSSYSNSIIFGKAQLSKIVSVETLDDNLEIFYKKEDGSTKSELIPNKYWILSDRRVEENWKRLKGNLHYKYGKQFSSIKEFYDTKYKFSKKYDIYSIADLKEASLVNKGICYYQDLLPSDISILSFDIETTGIEHNDDSKLLIISNTFRDSKGNITRSLFSYDQFNNEGEMIKSWVNWIQLIDPDILLSHNGFNFDFPYIKYIAERYDIDLNLGRDGSKLKFSTRSSQLRIDGNRDQEYFNIKCYGREIVDSYFFSMKYDVATKKYESYGLKKIIAQEGLEDKNRQHYDASQIRYKYKDPKEWEKIKNYAEGDGDDALKLWDLMGASFFYSAQMIPKPMQRIMLSATGSQINSILVRSYLQEGHSIPKADYSSEYEGAISLGVPGVYSNTFKVDILSCYPSTLIQYEVYPKHKDPNNNIINMVKYLFEQRKQYKKLAKETGKQEYKDMDSSLKILLNSIYGFYGATGLNFNYPKGAAIITRYARDYINTAIKWATNKDLEYWNKLNV